MRTLTFNPAGLAIPGAIGVTHTGIDRHHPHGHARLPLSHDKTNVPDEHPGCQYPSDDALFFTLPEVHDNMTTIAISTQWHMTYLGRLRRRLEKEMGAVVVPKSPSRCGWYALAPVKTHGVHRGEIMWYHPKTTNGPVGAF